MKRWMFGVALSIGLLGCGGGGQDQGDGEAAGESFRVGLVFDVGGKGDKSFNDSAYAGVVRAHEEFGIEYTDFEPGQDADRETGLRKLAARNYDMVIGVGFLFTDAIRSVAAAFPETKFVLIDGRVEGVDNVAALVFREQEGSYLVGALAALTSKTGKVGFIGGMDVPLIHRFEAGYRAGARSVDADVEVFVNYAGVTPEAFADPVKGKEMARSQMSRGADVLYHASGVTGLGVIEAAREGGAYAIGVDANQNHVAPGTMLTSMVKRIDVSIHRLIGDAIRGDFRGGLVEYGLAENAVGWALDEHNEALVPEAARAHLARLRDAIIAGEIDVPSESGRR